MTPLKRGLLLLTAALVAGLTAIYLSDRHLQQRAAEIEEQLTQDYARREVVVANRDLAAGEQLNADTVALREIPKTYLPKTAIDRTSWPDYSGGEITHPIGAGEPITPGQIQKTIHSRLADRISPGDRAITIPVRGTSAISGLLTPGDRVDLMLTINDENGHRTLPLLADVPIIATGALLEAGRTTAIEPGYNDITLAVSTREAAKITHAQIIGEIRPILRNDQDDKALPMHIIDQQTLLADFSNTGMNKQNQRQIELIVGGR